MDLLMDGWMGGLTDGWVDGCTNGMSACFGVDMDMNVNNYMNMQCVYVDVCLFLLCNCSLAINELILLML